MKSYLTLNGTNYFTKVVKSTVPILLLLLVTIIGNAQVYTTVLSGAKESPANASPGTGSVTVTIAGNTMRVQSTFSGLTGNTTACHIHAATAVAGAGTAGVATTTPTFPGFPNGVTAGTYDNTFDMTLSSSYNASYITANGGTPASAFIALKAAIAAGRSYFNLHSSAFPGGEIRGFLLNACQDPTMLSVMQNEPIAIAAEPGVVTSTINVTGAPLILSNLTVFTNITHTFPGDLDITLTSPAGTSVTITSDNGGTFENVFAGTLWDSKSNPSGTIPHSNGGNNGLVTDRTYANNVVATPLVPEESLLAFVGENPNGIWTLTVSDDAAGDGGILNNWSLNIAGIATPRATSTNTYNNASPISIPTTLATISSSITVSGAGSQIWDVTALTNITHSFNGDLQIALTSPAGTIVTLSSNNGGGNDNIFAGTTWSDNADPSNTAPFPTTAFAASNLVTDRLHTNLAVSPTLVPEEALRAFMGENPNGVWTLTISDVVVDDGGMLNSWGLTIKTTVCEATCTAPTNKLYVDASAAPGGTGGSWACAIKELSAAITMANANMAIKEIWVADGTYKPGTLRTDVMAINRGDLKILGGFAGGEANAADANPLTNPAIISGDIGVVNDASDNSYRLLFIGYMGEQPNITIDGFVLEKANASAPGDGDKSIGAALCTYGTGGTLITINRCNFRTNSATAMGAASFLMSASVVYNNCIFNGNSSTFGAGVFSFQANPTFNNCIFNSNTATNGGAAFYGNYGNATINKSVFNGNNALQGGAIYQNRADATINNSLFVGNNSLYGGGALFIHQASNTTLANSTLYANTSGTLGGGILLQESGSKIMAYNNILYKNTATGMANVAGADVTNYTNGANVWANNSLQQNTSVPADNGSAIRNNLRGVNPQFVNEANPLGVDGLLATTDDGLALSTSSPAKNVGDNALAPAGTDIANSTRVACGIVDIGAYENQSCDAPTFAVIEQAQPNTVNASGIVANPFGSQLKINYTGTEKAVAQVLSITGKKIWSANNIAQGITTVDASTWGNGMYNVVIITASGKKLHFKAIRL
jgi:subtilisin-like proprotein convertase family protein